MTAPQKPFGLRMPADVKTWLETRSIRNFRSMNAEIVAILAAVRAGEDGGGGFEKFANPSGVSGSKSLFPNEKVA